MSIITLDENAGRAVVLGGTVLGGGGGGHIEKGFEMVRLATSIGSPTLVSLDELGDEDQVATASAVGAPASEDRFYLPVDSLKAFDLVRHKLNKPLAGVIANENGPSSGVNGWLLSAVCKIPVVDAPANGRAHPTGLMGAMGMHQQKGYRSIQSAVGGDPDKGRYLEMVVEGQIETNANLVRHAAVEAGGFVMVVRDPISVSYLKENAAPGATTHAMKIGLGMITAMGDGPQAIINSILNSTGGCISCTGKVNNLQLETKGGYDLGSLTVSGENHSYLTFWNEFMTLDTDGNRQSTFPDLITIISLDTGIPISSAEIREGDEVAILTVPREKLILGKGVLLPEVIEEAERAIGTKFA